jgi:hypothetical protein
MPKSSAESAIRRYLNFLEDSSSLRDDAEIRRLENAVDKAIDPIDRLKAMAALERAKQVDGGDAEKEFVAVAKGWADANGVSAEHFRALGVAPAVLASAGFRGVRAARRGRGGRGGRAASRGRAKRVPVDDIKASLSTVGSRFTVRDLERASGGTNATVRKAVQELVKAGQARDLGADPNWSGRGRSPRIYERV